MSAEIEGATIMTAEGRSLFQGPSLFSVHLDFMLSLRYLKQPASPSIIVFVAVCVCVCGAHCTCMHALGSSG